MTVAELLQWIAQHPAAVGGALAAPPLIALLAGLVHGRGQGGRAPWRYVYAVLIYAACVPGIAAAVLTAYQLFFRHADLLALDVLVYYLPLATMAATLLLIRRAASFDAIPGFERLSGLMVLIALSFGAVLAVERTRIFVGFFGSLEKLIALGAFVFLLLRWAAHRAFRPAGDPSRERPEFPGA